MRRTPVTRPPADPRPAAVCLLAVLALAVALAYALTGAWIYLHPIA